ncbi:MAG TPA: ATPase [Syntrophomonas sp.]|nr:ATPase [Syntrophomonas sp.]HRW11981.1 ATPase [Syntrophomonas sp.]
MMEIFRILDELELLLKGSRKVPLTGGKSIIETSRFLDRVDRIRAILPEELETAKLIMAEKERIVSEACAEADKYLEHSKSHVAQMVDDNEITRSARGAAEEIIAQSEQIAAQIRRDADEYADGVLSHMEIVLRKGLEAVLQGRDDIREGLRSNDY